MYVQRTVIMQQEKHCIQQTAVSKDGHFRSALYTNKSGCVFDTPVPIHLAHCRTFEQ